MKLWLIKNQIMYQKLADAFVQGNSEERGANLKAWKLWVHYSFSIIVVFSVFLQ